MDTKKSFAIVVGGGPAPGINGVIAAATIEAVNRGYRVLGIQGGFKRLMAGDASCLRELRIGDVSSHAIEGGSILGISRSHPTKDPKNMETVLQALRKENVGYLVTIGGDGTATTSGAIAKITDGEIAVGHVPKTIDNDLPLPHMSSTFGFQTAREVGTDIVDTLAVDARTTARWYLVVAMGRQAGHLALGIGMAANATMTLIPEEFEGEKLPLATFADIIVAIILKRIAKNQPYGVVVLAEGLSEVIDQSTIPELRNAERDMFGNIRYAAVDFGGIIRNAVKDRLKSFGLSEPLVVDKNVGYELRCRSPIPFDREYTRQLGFGVVDFLCGGGSGAMITRQGDSLVSIPFREFLDPITGRAKVRMVDVHSPTYRIARHYMLRLSSRDMDDDELVSRMAQVTKKTPSEIREIFSPIAKRFGDLPNDIRPLDGAGSPDAAA